MKSILLLLTILSFAAIANGQNPPLPSDTGLYQIEIARGTIEEIKRETEQFKLKYPEVQTALSFRSPNFVLTTICEDRRKMEELIKAWPSWILKKCTKE